MNSSAAATAPMSRSLTAVRHGQGPRGESAGGLVGRFTSWAGAADAGETQWAAHPSPTAKVAGWSLVALLMAGGFVARANLGLDTESAWLLTMANAAALGLAIGGLRRARLAPVMHTGILAVFLLGGIFQLYLFSYNLFRHPTFITDQAPFHGFVTASDVANTYGLITLVFVIFCLMVAVLAGIPVATRSPRVSGLADFGQINAVLVAATIGFILVVAVQRAFGIGQAGLYNPSLPFHLVAVTLFYQRWIYPALLLLGIWVYDGRKPKLGYLCLLGTAIVAAIQSYGATSRGAIFSLGAPVVFVWLFTGRFTKFRKLLLIGGFGIYLIVAPVLSALRVNRILAASGTAPGAERSAQPLSAASLNYELGHVVFRVGGAGSMLFAIRNEDDLSLAGLERVYRPSGLTRYFTDQVVGVPVSSTAANSEAPTVIGLGTLIGGAQGAVLVLVLTVLGLELAWRWIAKKLQSWPVALAILGYAALTFFSEGVPIEFYKSFLAIAVVEVLYRRVARQQPPALDRRPDTELPVCSEAQLPASRESR